MKSNAMSSGTTICVIIVVVVALWPIISIFISAGTAIAIFVGTLIVFIIAILATIYVIGWLYEKARGRTPADIGDRVKGKYEEIRDCLKKKS